MLANISVNAKFQLWFPYFRETFANISTAICAPSLHAYIAEHLDFETATCYRHMDCMLSNMRESTKAHLSASGIILGLAPPVLTALGPSTSELSLLSARRPLLALLLAFASPAISFTMLFNPINPVHYLLIGMGAEDWSVKQIGPRVEPWLSATQYIILLGAIVNVVHNAYDLGIRTVLVWKCNAWFLPLLWSLLPGLINIIIIAVFNRSGMAKALRKSPVANRAGNEEIGTMTAANLPDVEVAAKGRQESFWRRELTLSSNQYKPLLRDIPPLENFVWVALIIGPVLGFLHTMVGTAILSSLMFISVLDSFVVVLRFGISGVICRAILVFEIAGINCLPN